MSIIPGGIHQCPSIPKRLISPNIAATFLFNNTNPSLVYNIRLGWRQNTSWIYTPTKVARVKKPSGMPMLFDAPEKEIEAGDNAQVCRYGSDYDYTLDPGYGYGSVTRHSGGANISFTDGHTEWIKPYAGIYVAKWQSSK
jgi:prepilin-type processing-associated H-X9-DG protein